MALSVLPRIEAGEEADRNRNPWLASSSSEATGNVMELLLK